MYKYFKHEKRFKNIQHANYITLALKDINSLNIAITTASVSTRAPKSTSTKHKMHFIRMSKINTPQNVAYLLQMMM